jgi:predicted ArsR family transcriptional regulator
MNPRAERRDAIATLAALDDPVRARLYAAIRAAGEPVTRERAATDAGISRKLAAFHLEKLVAVGLLDSRTDDRAPRRVGRAPKVYVPADSSVSVSVPPRAHDDLAGILVEAVATEAAGERPEDARTRVATETGRALGERVDRTAVRGRLGPERALARVEEALAERGYEPYRPDPGRIRLRNCPFHPLAERAPALVCGLNLNLLDGFLDGLGADSVEAVLAPEAGECCVEVRPRPTTAG